MVMRRGYPTCMIDANYIAGGDLSQYTTIVMPSVQAGALDRLLGDSGHQRLVEWVRNGGVLITMEGASAWDAAVVCKRGAAGYDVLSRRQHRLTAPQIAQRGHRMNTENNTELLLFPYAFGDLVVSVRVPNRDSHKLLRSSGSSASRKQDRLTRYQNGTGRSASR